MEDDPEYHLDCLQGLSQFTKDADVFLLVSEGGRTEYYRGTQGGRI
jgi:hypothetical protein